MPTTTHLIGGKTLMTLIILMALLGVQSNPGPVIAGGGGKLPDSISVRALELAGGTQAHIVVVPLASRRPEAGVSTVARFLALKAASSELLNTKSTADAIRQLKRATLVWMVGGSQTKLMEGLRQRKLISLIRERHKAGMVLAGSSAGAAVMSRIMIKGGAPLDSILNGMTPTSEGLDVVGDWIIDQHFMKRRRFGRLASCVVDHKARGIGIDEGTAVVFHTSGKLEVIGRSSAVIIDARNASTRKTGPGEPIGASGLVLHILTEGMTLK